MILTPFTSTFALKLQPQELDIATLRLSVGTSTIVHFKLGFGEVQLLQGGGRVCVATHKLLCHDHDHNRNPP